ncbi:MAG: hypothetical protein HYV07_02315 [Deltaproteobacteria bacterium]|nr:hypothetical protein [Deltaproteobacteria bacterium]
MSSLVVIDRSKGESLELPVLPAVLAVFARLGVRAEILGVASKVTPETEKPRSTTSTDVSVYGTVLDVLGDKGPKAPIGLLTHLSGPGPFLEDLLKWTELDRPRIPTAVVGPPSSKDNTSALVGRDHVRFIEEARVAEELEAWISLVLEVRDLRKFRADHDAVAAELRRARKKILVGEQEQTAIPNGPPCGPVLPTSIGEVLPIREARAAFERGLVKAAVRETGSLKDASVVLGISYTSLWRRMRY